MAKKAKEGEGKKREFFAVLARRNNEAKAHPEKLLPLEEE